MGYTHYWRKESGSISPDAWAKIRSDAAALVAASPAKLAYEYDEPDRAPVIDDTEIRFNAGDEDQACETFHLTPSREDFAFCKTRGYPYDVVVCGVLAAAAEHAPDQIRVSSDGTESEWEEPVAWASSVLGRPVPNPRARAEDES